jgi:short subunit fatty acids transporter
VIVRFVDIGGIVDHDCLNFLFIIVGLVNYHTPRDEVVGEYAGFTMSVRLSTRL